MDRHAARGKGAGTKANGRGGAQEAKMSTRSSESSTSTTASREKGGGGGGGGQSTVSSHMLVGKKKRGESVSAKKQKAIVAAIAAARAEKEKKTKEEEEEGERQRKEEEAKQMERDQECAICHDSMDQPSGSCLPNSELEKNGFRVLTLVCDHVFHGKCVDGWRKWCRGQGKTYSCPTCRGPLGEKKKGGGKRKRKRAY